MSDAQNRIAEKNIELVTSLLNSQTRFNFTAEGSTILALYNEGDCELADEITAKLNSAYRTRSWHSNNIAVINDDDIVIEVPKIEALQFSQALEMMLLFSEIIEQYQALEAGVQKHFNKKVHYFGDSTFVLAYRSPQTAAKLADAFNDAFQETTERNGVLTIANGQNVRFNLESLKDLDAEQIAKICDKAKTNALTVAGEKREVAAVSA
ncbi:MAG: hypothetical protein COV36_03645 [Alphaproteobacteria bacterium CG11_big_fil_rev_8_21_14_0_20_44_7]|nr:MAG: hypothetical protein COV36_03645 [Alphaproteobacteria bacterium CG11_big_fil_rev_8_21_14_0_20_44_7]